MPSYVVYWTVTSRQAIKRGDEKPMVVGKSSPFSHQGDAERWLEAKMDEYHTDPAHVAEGIQCQGIITPIDVPPLIIRHCHNNLVLAGERCPSCDTLVTNRVT